MNLLLRFRRIESVNKRERIVTHATQQFMFQSNRLGIHEGLVQPNLLSIEYYKKIKIVINFLKYQQAISQGRLHNNTWTEMRADEMRHGDRL